MYRVRRKTRTSRRAARNKAPAHLAEETFRAYQADEPHEKTLPDRYDPVEDTGLRITRSWSDPKGITHEIVLFRETWFVRCDAPSFRTGLKTHGSNKLRISIDVPTCFACAIARQWW